jgi:hypothetical protein
MSPEQVRTIQGVDLLDDPGQLEGFRALCGLGRDKPFECVGEAGESRAALAALASMDSWKEHAVVTALLPDLQAVSVPDLDSLLQPAGRHFIPQAILSASDLLSRAD